MPEPTRTARCHCGNLTLRCDGEPKKISMCHCLDCQRRSGSPFSVAVFFSRDKVRVASGSSQVYERPSASGFNVMFHFCLRCGANVYWEPRRLPELIGVAIGAFADPDFPLPEQSVWTTSKHHWIDLPDGMPAWDQNPVRPPSS